jgi:signal transduction histidine kinase
MRKALELEMQIEPSRDTVTAEATMRERLERVASADIAMSEKLVRHAAVAVETATLLDRERRRVALLAEAGRVLAKTTEVASTVDKICVLAVPALGTSCGIVRVDCAGPVLEAVAHFDAARDAALRARLGEAIALDPHAVHTVVDQGRPVASREALRGAELLSAGAMLALPLRSGDGSPSRMFIVALDDRAQTYDEHEMALAAELADRASLALDNARLHEIANRALAARDELMSFAAHDLRNFLGTVIAGTQLLERRRSAEAVQRYSEAIRRAVVRMESLTDALRDAGMIEAGRFNVIPRRELVAPLLAEAVETFQPRAESAGVRIVLVSPEEPIWVSCDRERMHQVIANLLTNAIDHTPRGGEVTVRVTINAGEDVVRFCVKDDGDGISEDDLRHIFERYWRKRPADDPRKKGTGLGLFISRGIIEAHGGKLWAEHTQGRGAHFCFTLKLIPT